MNTTDGDLERFLKAQEATYATALEELRRGKKSGHWMWFVFPQIIGLGKSETSQLYSIQSLNEAKAYIEHPILGSRLIECTRAVLQLEDRSVHTIFGYPDDLKFQSSMTLFARAASDPTIYQQALMKYFGGVPDPRTLRILLSIENVRRG